MGETSAQGFSPFAAGLREARLAKSLSVADAAKALLLSDTQIAGLEGDDFRAFYNLTFAERAARRYAEFLGLDLEIPAILQDAGSTRTHDEPPALKPLPLAAIGTRRGPLVTPTGLARGLMVVLGLVVVGLVAWQLRAKAPAVPAVAETPVTPPSPDATPVSAPTRVEPTAGADPAANAAASPATPAVTAASTLAPVADDFDHRFFIVVTRDVRIQASDARGVALLSGLQPPSMGQRVVGEPPFSIAISDEDAVEIYYRGQRIRPGPTVYDGIAVTVVR